jgi:mannosyltransferase OCH1-like enzyme
MIPKIIHYCWLSGNPYPELIKKCIDSWKNILPDYQIILWDTNRIDINSNLWLKQACEKKKYAFASDYVRFYALYNYGGIYLDADVEVIKSFNELIHQKYFLGKEITGDIEAAVMGAEKGLHWVNEGLNYYKERPFIKENGLFDKTPVPLIVSQIAEKYNLDIFPCDFFSANNYQTGKKLRSENTFCIHHFEGKWFKKDFKYKMKMNIHRFLYFFLGVKGHNALTQMIRQIIGKGLRSK